MAESKKSVVGIIMGSSSDLDVMALAADILEKFNVGFEVRIVSAHRTPDVMTNYAKSAKKRGLKVIIAGAGGSAHLPGMTAANTSLPVLAVPIKRENHDHEALWSSVKMPPGVPLATMPENGAKNAALFAISILSVNDSALAKKYDVFEKSQHDEVVKTDKQIQKDGWRKVLG